MRTNLKYTLAQLKSVIFGVDVDAVAEWAPKIPKKIDVEIGKDGKVFFAIIKSIDGKSLKAGYATQAKTVEELVRMVNDLVQTYLDIPPEVCARMPLLLPDGFVARKKLIGNNIEFART